jgi:hypothetical protein
VKPDRVSAPFVPVTINCPEEPAPTTAMITESDRIVKDWAGVPPKLMAVAVDKYFPLMVIGVPVPPLDGEKEVISRGVGGGGALVINVKMAVVVSVPGGPITATRPVAPVPTTADIAVSDRIVKDAAGTLLKKTLAMAVKPVPASNTVVPAGPDAGVKE